MSDVKDPRFAYVVMTATGIPCFAGDTFERAAERANALMHGECMSEVANLPTDSYRIVRVEAE